MKLCPKPLLVLVIAAFFAFVGACIDFYYEWPVTVPGDPASSLYTFRDAAGINHGWISYSTDDVFAYDNLKPGFSFSVHAPVFRVPAGYGGWMDFSVCGVAPWFLALIVVLLAWLWQRFCCKTDKPNKTVVDNRLPAPRRNAPLDYNP